jgi:hypothetical protein
MSVLSNRKSDVPADAGAYISAILDLLGDRDPVEVLRQTPGAVRTMLGKQSDEALRRPEAPGKWSAVEVVQHLADSDLVWAYRMRLVIAEDRPGLTGFDQDLWATRLRYRDVQLAAALEQFGTLRAINLRLIATLNASDLERVGVHTERGDERLDHMIRLYAGHDLAHLRQLTRILDVDSTAP